MDVGALPMMRLAAFLLATALMACSPPQQAVETTDIVPCADIEPENGLEPGECQLEASGQTLHVKFQPIAAGAETGAVSIDVLGEDGAVVQTMLEPDVTEYIAPIIQDVDGDGRADILAARESGNVNTTYGVWIFNGERGVYERVGDLSAVEIERTSDGLIAAVARSSANSWSVAFSKLDEGGLHLIASVYVTAPEEEGGTPTCTLEESQGIRDLNLTEQAARERFCAEPAAQVFE
jgi:hypothetical protein